MHGRQWAATRKYPPLGRCRGTGGDRAIDTATGEMEMIPTLPGWHRGEHRKEHPPLVNILTIEVWPDIRMEH